RDVTGYIHHEGIYVGGDRFLHAPRTGDVVKISSLNEPYYAGQLAGARRVAELADAGAAVPATDVPAAPVAAEPAAPTPASGTGGSAAASGDTDAEPFDARSTIPVMPAVQPEAQEPAAETTDVV